MSGVLPSATLLINEQSRKLACAGRKIYRFGFGQSPFPVLPAAVSALQAHASEKAYSAVQGLAELRQAAAAFHNARDAPAQWDADRVLVAPGSKLLLWASLTALQGRALSGVDDPRFTKGARLLLPAPCWVSYAPQARLAGMSLEPLPGDAGADHRWAPPVAVADEQCGRAVAEGYQPVLLLNSPNNPTGQVLHSQQVADLANVAREHSAVVISDEIYGPLTFGEHTAFAAHYPERTITTSGLSKWCGAGGWRLGVMHVPTQLGAGLFQDLLGLASETWSCAPLPIQYAGIEAYSSLSVDAYLEKQRRILRLIGTWCASTLRAHGVEVHDPEGGFYIYPDFGRHRAALHARGIESSDELTHRLLQEAGVALLPGTAFGAPQEHLTARLAFVDFDGAALLQVAADADLSDEELLLHPALQDMRAGIDAVGRWLEH